MLSRTKYTWEFQELHCRILLNTIPIAFECNQISPCFCRRETDRICWQIKYAIHQIHDDRTTQNWHRTRYITTRGNRRCPHQRAENPKRLFKLARFTINKHLKIIKVLSDSCSFQKIKWLLRLQLQAMTDLTPDGKSNCIGIIFNLKIFFTQQAQKNNTADWQIVWDFRLWQAVTDKLYHANCEKQWLEHINISPEIKELEWTPCWNNLIE